MARRHHGGGDQRAGAFREGSEIVSAVARAFREVPVGAFRESGEEAAAGPDGGDESHRGRCIHMRK